MFPALMTAIALTQMLSDATRAEQAPQAVANRAARVTPLCCYQIDDTDGTAATVRAGLKEQPTPPRTTGPTATTT